jgi:Protein of unknown function (DUF1592)/Protein of unknown function (DUF1588)/Protein of unknown function (DUF1595)/Protein of unknown function (DUF1587)
VTWRGLALALVAAAGCTASIEGSGTPGPAGPGTGTPVQPPGTAPVSPPGAVPVQPPGSTTTPVPPPSAQVTCPAGSNVTVGHPALRRLTNAELEATIRAAFGLDANQWSGLTVPPDAGSVDGFTNNVDKLTVGPDYVRGAMDSSRKIAAVVSADPVLGRLLPCAATGGAPCADSFLTTFGPRLYRRPLTAPEKARFLSLLDKVSVGADFRSWVYWSTSTMLQSPSVIYRSELGDPDGSGRFKLTPYEIASNLAYTYTGGPPSAELMQLAAANKLSTADEVEAAARTLVFDGQTIRPAFRDVLLRFADQWLGLGALSNLKKDATLYPDFDSQVQDSLAEETRRFISAVILEDRGGVASLLTAPYTFVDARLATYYGFGAATGTSFARVTRPPGWGVGLLSQGALLAVEANGLSTSPTKRGHMVRTRLMCGVVPPPPPVVGPIPPPTEANTTRQRYESLHGQAPTCKACHALMDPIGFAFEHLDSAGRYRAREGMFDIDDSAVVTGSSAGDLKVKGPTELATALAGLPEVNDCLASYIAGYALGLAHESAACLLGPQIAELRAGGSLVDFYVRMSRADHFRLRQ